MTLGKQRRREHLATFLPRAAFLLEAAVIAPGLLGQQGLLARPSRSLAFLAQAQAEAGGLRCLSLCLRPQRGRLLSGPVSSVLLFCPPAAIRGKTARLLMGPGHPGPPLLPPLR